MATTPLFNKIWKIFSWLGRAATVGAAAGATAGSLMILSLHNIHLFSFEKVGDNSNKVSDTQGPVEINSLRTNTNTVTNNTWNIQVDNSNHYKVGEVINLNLRVVKVNQNSNSITVRVDSP